MIKVMCILDSPFFTKGNIYECIVLENQPHYHSKIVADDGVETYITHSIFKEEFKVINN